MSRKAPYRSSPTKRHRRSAAAIEAITSAIYQTVAADQPMTVRQVFYRLVSEGVIPKTEAEYKQTVCRLLGIMRKRDELPYDWIADNTRWMRKPRTYDSLKSMLTLTQDTYRRALWNDQDAYVEVWCEKDALAGVLLDSTSPWDVPLMVTRGFSSLSYLYDAAQVLKEKDKPCHLYYFGDHDPSGVSIPVNAEQQLRKLAPDADIHFERVAVNEWQIEEWSLPTRPTKRTDSRSKSFKGESVELDAIPAGKLRELCESCIVRHIDDDALERTERIEEAERETLRRISKRLKAV